MGFSSDRVSASSAPWTPLESRATRTGAVALPALRTAAERETAGDAVHLESAHPRSALSSAARYEEARVRRLAAVAAQGCSNAGADASGRDKAVETAVVVGGGPGGLAAAVKLAERGVKVTVLELRAGDYARPHHLNLRQNTVDALHYLGVFDAVMERSGWMHEEHLAHDGVSIASTPLPPDAARLHDDALTMLEDDSVLQVRISDVENALYERARALGVSFHDGVRADLLPDAENGAYSVTMQPVRHDGGGFIASGPPTPLGTPDLVVVADGANSQTRAQLGIDFESHSEPRYYLGGQVEVPIGPVTRKYARQAEEGGVQRLMATGHARYPSVWVSVEVGEGVRTMGHDERVRALCNGASAVLFQEVQPAQISWGAGQITRVQDRIASRFTAGSNVVLYGDAGRTGDVWTSGGLNLALTADVLNLMHLVDNLESGRRSRDAALDFYGRHMRRSSSSWHVVAANARVEDAAAAGVSAASPGTPGVALSPPSPVKASHPNRGGTS